MKKIFWFILTQVVSGGLITVYIESVASGNLLFTNGVFASEFQTAILAWPRSVISGLIFINAIANILIYQASKNKKTKIPLDNICELVFNQFIKSNTKHNNSNYRVSLFKVGATITINTTWPFFFKTTVLRNVGRYQTKQDNKLSKMTFKLNIGSVGQCYALGEIVCSKIEKHDPNNEEKYYTDQKNKFSVSKKLKTKSCCYISIPVKYFNSDELFGVVVVDSTKPNSIPEGDFRKIEGVMENASVFFNKEL